MHRLRAALLASGLLALSVFTCGASPISDLLSRVEALEAGFGVLVARVEAVEQTLFPPTEQVLLDDDFEDGLDPSWVQVIGTTQTIAPTGDCTQAYWSRYANCGSLGLHFDEEERYDYQLPVATTGSFSLYFHDDPADKLAVAWAGVHRPGGQERLGVDTRNCPNHYYISLNAGSHRCTIIPRRLGWHRVEFVRTGLTTKGYFDHVLLYETNHQDRPVIESVTVWQERSDSLLDGFAIDDVRFVATE